MYRIPLLHHIITLGDEGAPPRERVAVARLLVKEFGADPVSAYAWGDVATPLLTALSQGEMEIMDFLISGKSALRSEFLYLLAFPLSFFFPPFCCILARPPSLATASGSSFLALPLPSLSSSFPSQNVAHPRTIRTRTSASRLFNSF